MAAVSSATSVRRCPREADRRLVRFVASAIAAGNMLLREPLDGAGKRSPGRNCGDRARSVTGRAFIPASVFRYRRRSRRSQGSLPQQCFRLVSARRSDKGILPVDTSPGKSDRERLVSDVIAKPENRTRRRCCVVAAAIAIDVRRSWLSTRFEGCRTDHPRRRRNRASPGRRVRFCTARTRSREQACPVRLTDETKPSAK